jgi:hemoglobin
MADKSVPTLFEWLGGMPALDRLRTRFYERVKDDPILAPIFANMGGDHPHHVAVFLAEVLGGPAGYSEQFGGHPRMIQRHLNRHLTHAQRRQWVSLLLDTADQIGMPDDPEFRSALVGYLEWGSRLAVINSQPGASVDQKAPMPKWGWGEVKGPYKG